MIRMSFYDGTLDRKILRAFVETTDKNILYTMGLEYRSPSIHRKPISVDEALEIIEKESWLDAMEYDDCIHLNAFSANDMY